MPGGSSPLSRLTRAGRWSVYAGLYAFVCGTVMAVLFSNILGSFGEVVGLPATWGLLIIATPTLLFGPVVWWAVVERSGPDSLLLGAGFGVITALFTGAFWTTWFASVWGLKMVTVSSVQLLVGFVVGISAVFGGLVGLPFYHARRRF